MKSVLIIVVPYLILVQLCTPTNGLKCHFGVEAPALGGLVTPDFKFKSKTCAAGKTHCFRAEAVVHIPDTANVTINDAGVCMTSAECKEVKKCQDLIGVIAKVIPKQYAPLILNSKPQIKHCAYTCCDEDNCNVKTVAEINAERIARTKQNQRNGTSRTLEKSYTQIVLLLVVAFLFLF